MKLKINVMNKKLLVFLSAIMPLVDTINGWFIRTQTYTEGLSIGTLYRSIIIVWMICILIRSKKSFLYMIFLIYFFVNGISAYYLRPGEYGISLYIAYAMKWIFVPMYSMTILHICGYQKEKILPLLYKIWDIWSYLFSIILIGEYVLKIGYSSYHDAGFKGLFDSTNDLAYVLSMLSIYNLYKIIHLKASVSSYVKFLLVLIAIVLLGTKSPFIFIFLSFVYFMAFTNMTESDFHKKMIIVISLTLLILFVSIFMSSKIENVYYRYLNYYYAGKNNGISSLESLINMLTSSRIYRIIPYFKKISMEGNIFINLLFGWISPVYKTAIEMDWFDLAAQYGLIGVIILAPVYLCTAWHRARKPDTYPFWIMYLCSLIAITFSGHVISSAFSGSMFAMICSIQIAIKRSIRKPDSLRQP